MFGCCVFFLLVTCMVGLRGLIYAVEDLEEYDRVMKSDFQFPRYRVEKRANDQFESLQEQRYQSCWTSQTATLLPAAIYSRVSTPDFEHKNITAIQATDELNLAGLMDLALVILLAKIHLDTFTLKPAWDRPKQHAHSLSLQQTITDKMITLI